MIESFREEGWDGRQVRSTGSYIEGSHAFDNRSAHFKTFFCYFCLWKWFSCEKFGHCECRENIPIWTSFVNMNIIWYCFSRAGASKIVIIKKYSIFGGSRCWILVCCLIMIWCITFLLKNVLIWIFSVELQGKFSCCLRRELICD